MHKAAAKLRKTKDTAPYLLLADMLDAHADQLTAQEFLTQPLQIDQFLVKIAKTILRQPKE